MDHAGLSPALIGIGYIIGPRYAFVNAAGGLLAWWVLIPLLLFFDPDLPASPRFRNRQRFRCPRLYALVQRRPADRGRHDVGRRSKYVVFHAQFSDAIGAGRLHGSKQCGECQRRADRTGYAHEMGLLAMVALVVATALVYVHFTGNVLAAVVAAVAMTLTGFLLCAVGGYLVGLVGSSNQPLSGLTLSSLILSALLLTAFGVRGTAV